MMADIEQLLRRTMGMTAESIGSSVIQRAVRDRMADCDVQEIEEYWQLLNGPGRELTDLIEGVVVPETWFFRYPEAFSALTHLVHTKWLPAHPTGTLRVLSAPCSTGEEPYSIAIALLESGLPLNRFHIDAIDISERALAFARRGVYSANSFRGNDVGIRERYCRPVLRGYQLVDTIRTLVHFHQRNLVSEQFHPPYPSYDVVFCRNVLIYLDLPTQANVLNTLQKAMTMDGYLFVGPAEVPAAMTQGFQPLGFPMAFAHQNSRMVSGKSHTVPYSTVSKTAPPLRSRASIVPRSVADRRSAPSRTSNAVVPRETKTVVDKITLDTARALADAGRLGDAAAACKYALREDPSADGYCLLGVIYDALRDHRQAEACYRKALFLMPDHQEAVLHLATLLRNSGDNAGARRFEGRVRRTGGET